MAELVRLMQVEIRIFECLFITKNQDFRICEPPSSQIKHTIYGQLDYFCLCTTITCSTMLLPLVTLVGTHYADQNVRRKKLHKDIFLISQSELKET